MDTMKRLASIVLALVLVFSIAAVALSAGENGSITIKNAAKGETYSVVKLFDASVTGEDNGSIVYTGTIPDELKDYFQEENGYITAKESAKTEDGSLSADAISALVAWAEKQTATQTIKGDGGEVVFSGLPFGYYVVMTTQGTAITVASTNPNAIIYDKNSKEPGITKSVDDPDVYIGQNVVYTTTASTANYLGTGKDAEIVTQYVIEDTLPDFLTDVTITNITIGGAPYTVDGQVPQFAVVSGHTNKAVIIPWAEKDENGKYVSLYNNGAAIIITYTATVTDKAVIDGDGNTNKVILTPYTSKDGTTPGEPWNKTWEDEETIKTYAAALKKVDENDAPLAGAKFAANGLTVSGSKGNYTVTAYDPESTQTGTVMETDDHGHLVIKGLPSDVSLTVTETEAPSGYNKLAAPITLSPTIIAETVTVTSTTTYYDENDKVTEEVTETSTTVITYNQKLEEAAVKVENKAGAELPSTGGMGTTLLYVVGSLLVVGAFVVLITKKRMSADQ